MSRTILPDPEITGTLPHWIDGFLREETCSKLLDELAITVWKPSLVVHRRPRGELLHTMEHSRRSETAHERWFSAEPKRVLRRVERRLESLLGPEIGVYEQWQATRYRHGDTFEDHFDAGHWSGEPYGERARTVVIYLNDPSRGAGTRFRKLGLEVDAKRGRLLTWGNLLPNGERDPRMMHAGLPVRRGFKTILVTWIRQHKLDDGRTRMP